MRGIDNESLSRARFMGVRYYPTSDYVMIVQIPRTEEQINQNGHPSFKRLKILISAIFSFGVFRPIVLERPFKKRILVYSLTILCWLISAILIATLTAVISKSFSLSILALVATTLMSYGAFQMLIMEYNRFNIYCYQKNTSGIWVETRFDEDAILQPNSYLDYLLPIRVFIKHLKFVLST